MAVAERVEVPVLFSEEAVFLALSHSLRETGQREAALAALTGLPPSLPTGPGALLAGRLRWDGTRTWWSDTEGLLNGDDLSAALLLVRARSLRRLGANAAARAALQEVLRRRKTDLTLRSDALTDRALLLLDNGRKSLNRRDWQHRRPADLETFEAIRKDAEAARALGPANTAGRTTTEPANWRSVRGSMTLAGARKQGVQRRDERRSQRAGWNTTSRPGPSNEPEDIRALFTEDAVYCHPPG